MSFHIRPGESVAIVGATGAGKTSLISILSRFYDIQAGQILLDGVDIRDLKRSDVRKHIGTVLQDAVLFSGTITSNIRLHNTGITDEQVRDAAVFVNADTFIERLADGYDHIVRERGANFSSGQRQLIAFARAIAFDPEVLLVLDEATSSVDTETEALIQDALERLMQGRTSIIIAHRLFTIRHVDRILVLHKGQLVEEGSHDELLMRAGFLPPALPVAVPGAGSGRGVNQASSACMVCISPCSADMAAGSSDGSSSGASSDASAWRGARRSLRAASAAAFTSAIGSSLSLTSVSSPLSGVANDAYSASGRRSDQR